MRWASPPEHWLGSLSSRGVIRTISATSRTRFFRVSGSTFFMRGPNSMFWKTVLWGKRARFWKTMPRFRWPGSISFTRRPSMKISPAVGSSRPAIMRRVVVLPHPEGPTRTRNSSASMERSRSFTASMSRPNTFLSPLSSICATIVYLLTIPKLNPRTKCLRMNIPTIISGRVIPTARAA